MRNREVSELIELAIPFLMVAAVSVPVLAWQRARLRAAWLRRLPVAPRLWNILHFLAFYALFIALMGTMSAVLQSAGLFDWLYGQGRVSPVSGNAEALGSVAGGAAADRATAASKSANQLRMLWASLIAVPLVLLAVRGFESSMRRLGDFCRPRDLWADLLLGLGVSVVGVPLVLLVHAASIFGFQALGGVPEDHPLTLLGAGSTWWETSVFWLSVCLLIPCVEEVLFRGLLLRWTMSSFGAVMIVFVLAFLLAAAPGFEWDPRLGPIALVSLALLFVFAYHRYGKRSMRRTVGGVASTSALFAAAHANVWPSPIPLFALGAILALTMVKTGRITGAVVVHGFFNSVSFLYLIRTGPLA